MTKIVLGIIATNEELPLSKFLPGLSEAFKGDVIGIDYESTDKTPELFKEYCKYSITEPWPRDFSKAKNQLMGMAERVGYDWMLLLDADENMDVKKIPLLEKYIEQNPYSVYYFPRIGFLTEEIIEGSMDGFPDLQSRLFRLNSGFKYQEKTHCQLCVDGENVFELGEGCVIPDIFIYHYGGLKGPNQFF